VTEIFESIYIYLSAYNIPHTLPVEAQIDRAVLIKATLCLPSIALLDFFPAEMHFLGKICILTNTLEELLALYL
jgi:hypothetical protein